MERGQRLSLSLSDDLEQAWDIAVANRVKFGPPPLHWRPPPQLTQHMPFYSSPTVISTPLSLSLSLEGHDRIAVRTGLSLCCIRNTLNSMLFR